MVFHKIKLIYFLLPLLLILLNSKFSFCENNNISEYDNSSASFKNHKINRKSLPPSPINFTDLPERISYKKVMEYLDYIKDNYPDVELKELRKTAVGKRRIVAVLIYADPRERQKDRKKPVIVMTASLAGDRPVHTAACLYAINQLVVAPENNTALVSLMDWVIVPLANPDGYENRVRGNARSYQYYSSWTWQTCNVVQAYHNFPVGFEGNTWKCYGPRAFSEQESLAVRDAMEMFKDRNLLYIYIELNDPMITYPPQWNSAKTAPNLKSMIAIAEAAKIAVRECRGALRGSNYIIKMSAFDGGPRLGEAMDYAIDYANFPYALNLQLPFNVTTEEGQITTALKERAEEAFCAIKDLAYEAYVQNIGMSHAQEGDQSSARVPVPCLLQILATLVLVIYL